MVAFVNPIVAPANDDLITTQRVALAVHHLGCLGEVMTTRQVADLVGLSYHGARKMLEKISGAHSHDGVGIPLVELDGYWMYMPADN